MGLALALAVGTGCSWQARAGRGLLLPGWLWQQVWVLCLKHGGFNPRARTGCVLPVLLHSACALQNLLETGTRLVPALAHAAGSAPREEKSSPFAGSVAASWGRMCWFGTCLSKRNLSVLSTTSTPCSPLGFVCPSHGKGLSGPCCWRTQLV